MNIFNFFAHIPDARLDKGGQYGFDGASVRVGRVGGMDMRYGALGMLGIIALTAAGCATFEPPPPPPAPKPAITPAQLVGRWGLASYHVDKDRDRTLKEAKSQCNRPYIINPSPNGGVMINLADQKDLSEAVVKVAPDGRTYLGPAGDPGGGDDRLITQVTPDASSFSTIWVDDDSAKRYGTMVYVRCPEKKS